MKEKNRWINHWYRLKSGNSQAHTITKADRRINRGNASCYLSAKYFTERVSQKLDINAPAIVINCSAQDLTEMCQRKIRSREGVCNDLHEPVY